MSGPGPTRVLFGFCQRAESCLSLQDAELNGDVDSEEDDEDEEDEGGC